MKSMSHNVIFAKFARMTVSLDELAGEMTS
jgi:hypothetical protein